MLDPESAHTDPDILVSASSLELVPVHSLGSTSVGNFEPAALPPIHRREAVGPLISQVIRSPVSTIPNAELGTAASGEIWSTMVPPAVPDIRPSESHSMSPTPIERSSLRLVSALPLASRVCQSAQFP